MSDHLENGFLARDPIDRAAISYLIRKQQDGPEVPFLKTDWLSESKGRLRLPTPPEQARNFIGLIGDYVHDWGTPLRAFSNPCLSEIGVLNRARAQDLFRELERKGLVRGNLSQAYDGALFIDNMDLTLAGWEEYEALKSGRRAGHFGFLAMQYNDDVLEEFVSTVVKPQVKDQLGYDLVDLRDESRAGVIDNIMREKIRDSAFVLADLTHDNYGAYWEAGYAEGLGKPVVYICERTKFENAKTHFDTNHCTTVLWEATKGDRFALELVATLRRSMGLFPSN